MRHWLAPTMGLMLLALGAGCDALLDLLRPDTVTVRLVNNSDFPVEVHLVYDDDQALPREVLLEVGTGLEFTLGAGESITASRNCEDLQVIIIDDADLMIIGGIGPEAETGVLRDGDDFGCGDTIVFTFDHSDLLVDFDISVDVRQ